MRVKGRWSRAGLGLAIAVSTLALFAQGCDGTSGGAGGVQGPPSSESAEGAELAVAESAADQAGPGRAGPGRADAGQGFERMVVKTAELGVRTRDVRASLAKARDVSARFDGDVLSSRVYGGEGPVSADLVLAVPSEEFEAVLDELRGLGRQITTDAVRGQDVTEEFVDLGSRERNLLAAEESLLALYDRAESVDDTLEVQRELTVVRGQIEEVQGRMQYLEDRTATSRISLTVEPISAPTPRQTWDPTLVATRAWDASLHVLQAGATAVISAAVFCWWLVPAAAVGLVWWRRYAPSRE